MQRPRINTGLVSVIITVYNVENYLQRCIKSVIDQSYLNLEIILVDDGSSDGSSDICDRYSLLDARVQVLHKKNGGVAHARNAGLNLAQGQYIYFVDSDDFIAEDAIDLLYKSIISHNADIATHSFVIYRGEGADTRSYTFASNREQVLSNDDALGKLLYENSVTTSPCMKLYKRKLFGSSIRFPAGKMCEDLGTIYKLFSASDKVVLNSIPKYFYYLREGSLTKSGFNSSSMDGLDIAKEQLSFISMKHPAQITAAKYRLFAEAVYIIMKLPLDRNLYKYERKELLKVINSYKKTVLLNQNARVSMRARALICYFSPGLMILSFKTLSYGWRNLNNIVK